MTQPENFCFFPVSLQWYKVSQSTQFSSALQPLPSISMLWYISTPQQWHIPKDFGFKGLCSQPSFLSSTASDPNLGTNATEQTKPLSPLSTYSLHIYTKAHSKDVHNSVSGSRTAFLRQNPLSFDSRLISIRNALSKHCARSCTTFSRQKSSTFHFQAWRGETKGSTTFRKPCHVLWRNQRSRAVHTISEQHSGLFLLTVIALTAPKVGKEINIPLLVSQLYFPHSLRDLAQILQVKWIPYQLQLLSAWKSIPVLGADIPWRCQGIWTGFYQIKKKTKNLQTCNWPLKILQRMLV